ncbi:MAG: hypothetical protein WAS07_00755 [Micropruina sp.]
MGALLNPVGPESAATYWIRRSIVVGGAIIVLLGLIWMVSPKGTTAVPVAAASPPSLTASAPAPAPSPSTSVSEAPVATPTGPIACDPLSTALTVAGFRSVKVGAKQVFTVTATNSTDVACVLDIAPATFNLSVASGTDRIFATADCAKWLPAKKLTLKPKGTHEFKVEWNLKRSSAGCTLAKKGQGAGTYVTTGAYLETGIARLVWVIKK